MIRQLICFDQERGVSVVRLRAGQLEFLCRDGQREFPLTDDFWPWWKQVSSYVDGDEVDICVVYDQPNATLSTDEVLANNVINTEQSLWQLENLREFMGKMKPSLPLNLIIEGAKGQELALGGDKKAVQRRFYTNLDFLLPGQHRFANGEAELSYEEGDCSPLARIMAGIRRQGSDI